MKRLFFFLATFLTLCCCQPVFAKNTPGAVIPWVTYEAEQMHTNGVVLSASYAPFQAATESSGGQAVQLQSAGQYVAFAATAKANSMIIRYSLPDDKNGGGLYTHLEIRINGKPAAKCRLSSRYAWLYGKYPFTNNPADGKPRHFYDEIQIKELPVAKGDSVRLVWAGEGNADYCTIDLVDMEQVAPAAAAPPKALWLTDKRFTGNETITDFTEALRKCIAEAVTTGKTVWLPAGSYPITGNITLPPHITIKGAGMWHTVLTGSENVYTDANRRVRLIGGGDSIHLADFSIQGALDYRNDQEGNDGITGTFGHHSLIENIWIEHTKVGMWVENSRQLTIRGCRLRNTIADGINFCVGMAYSVIENCSARGTGDDGFAMWPAVFAKQVFAPGHNQIVHCTAQLPFLANGAAIYGGENNSIQSCLFTDISQGAAVLISTTFPTESKTTGINNNFTGTTTVENCVIKNSGGFDHEWGWRGAIEICLDKRSISSVTIKQVSIAQSLSNAISVVTHNNGEEEVVLQQALAEHVTVTGYGRAATGRHALFIDHRAHGAFTIRNSSIPEVQYNKQRFSITR
jgi:hypothetical protein